MGGFARRTSYWNAFARKFPGKAFLKIDGGSIFKPGVAEEAIVSRWMLEGTYRSRLDALNLTALDLPIWQMLADMAAAGQVPREFLDVPLVSANVTAKVANFPKIQPYVLREFDAGNPGRRVRVGITGVLYDPDERISRTEFSVERPEDAARRIMTQALGPGQVDYRILLTDSDLGKAVSMAVMVPGINVIVVAHDYGAAIESQQVGETVIVMAVNEGRVITEMRVGLTGAKAEVESRFVPLDRTVPDDPEMAALIRRAQAEVDAFKKGE